MPIQLEHISEEALKKEIRRVLGQYLDLNQYKVFFFGSRVKGTSSPRADIDLGIEGPRAIPAEIRLELEEQFENLPILYKIDCVDFKEVSAEFRRIALQDREFI